MKCNSIAARVRGALARTTALALLAGSMSLPGIAAAAKDDEPTQLAMVGDVLVARPVGIVLTAIGAAAFVVSLPFSAASGSIEEAGETLVVGPAKETFVRCLGCTRSGWKEGQAR